VSSPRFTPPIQRSLRTGVYEAIRHAIVSGAIASGERINEAEIARQMQISRAPIREAIRQLEQEGLLVSWPHRGTFVFTLSGADIEEVYTLRADVESRAVYRALPRLEPEQFALLESLVAEMQVAAAAGDLPQLLEADIQFHRTIVEAAGWPRLKKIWEGLHPQTLTLYTLTTLADWPTIVHAQRHVPLLEALQTGDAHRAAQAMRSHIEDVGAQVILRRTPGPRPDPQ
jgi:DNA-binding GntR family transcriptional regulator